MENAKNMKEEVLSLFDNNVFKGGSVDKMNLSSSSGNKTVKKTRTYVHLLFGPKIKK